jgi:hypothetical protein
MQSRAFHLILAAVTLSRACVGERHSAKLANVADQTVVKQWKSDAAPGTASQKDARANAAKDEAAWKGVGLKPGTWIWRIEEFAVVPWPKKKYGQFHKGDSYILLSVKKRARSSSLIRDIHFWLGLDSSDDEKGTAALKTVELDDFFGGVPTQHREVMGSESQEFLRLFPKGVQYLDGGVDSGFDPADPTAYRKKLYLVRKTRAEGLRILEMPVAASSLNQNDCFVLDAGNAIRSWCGNDASPWEKFKAGRFAEDVEDQNGGFAKHQPDTQGAPSDKFWEMLGDKGEIAADFSDDMLTDNPMGEGTLYALMFFDKEKGTGELKLEKIADGDLRKDQLRTDDVMMVDTGKELFLWIGKAAHKKEKRNAMDTAQLYIKTNNMPSSTPIHMFKEGVEITNAEWLKMFDN